jgi:hypothetical protein
LYIVVGRYVITFQLLRFVEGKELEQEYFVVKTLFMTFDSAESNSCVDSYKGQKVKAAAELRAPALQRRYC